MKTRQDNSPIAVGGLMAVFLICMFDISFKEGLKDLKDKNVVDFNNYKKNYNIQKNAGEISRNIAVRTQKNNLCKPVGDISCSLYHRWEVSTLSGETTMFLPNQNPALTKYHATNNPQQYYSNIVMTNLAL